MGKVGAELQVSSVSVSAWAKGRLLLSGVSSLGGRRLCASTVVMSTCWQEMTSILGSSYVLGAVLDLLALVVCVTVLICWGLLPHHLVRCYARAGSLQ
jgi:hypothetical protein